VDGHAAPVQTLIRQRARWGLPFLHRQNRGNRANTSNGENIHSSVRVTSHPRAESAAGPIGATGIGRHGANSRASLNGHSRAIPSPPSVNASSSGWLTPTAQAINAARQKRPPSSRTPSAAASPSASPIASEWTAPRCPHGAL